MFTMAKVVLATTLLLMSLAASKTSFAGLIFEPYYSVSSTKSIKPQPKTNSEKETISQREEKGIRAGLSFYRFFKLALSLGESFHVTTKTESLIKDEYGEIDFAKELDSSTIGQSQKKKEIQRRGRFTFIFDPSFSIFIIRTKIGLTAKQRIIKLYSDDILQSSLEPEPTYKPHAGVGLGIRFSRKMYFLAEYGFYYYKFPKLEPFERNLTVSFGVSI